MSHSENDSILEINLEILENVLQSNDFQHLFSFVNNFFEYQSDIDRHEFATLNPKKYNDLLIMYGHFKNIQKIQEQFNEK